LEEIKEKEAREVVYLDESGIDDNETNPYAWGKKGMRIYGVKNAKRTKRLSIIAALNENHLQAPFVFEGTCNRQVFETYLEKVLVPTLKKGQTVVMDNASFHKGGYIHKIITDAQCDLLYLPSYSPDLNPIEHHWTSVKNRVKNGFLIYENDIYEAANYAFQVS
jgi:transposase